MARKAGPVSNPFLTLVLAVALLGAAASRLPAQDKASGTLTLNGSTVATIEGHEEDRVIEYIVTLTLEDGTWKIVE